MTLGFRAEVGYNDAKDYTYLRTNTPDFNKQLHIPIERGSAEDIEIRTLLEDQGIVDFTAITSPITLTLNPEKNLASVSTEMYFGMEGTKENKFLGTTTPSTIVPICYRHVVLFGKKGSGAANLIRFWLLYATAVKAHIVTVGTPEDIYGTVSHLNSERTHVLNPTLPLRAQFARLGKLGEYGVSRLVFIVGADYEAKSLADRLFLKEMQDDIHADSLTFIHRAELLQSEDEYFTGSDGMAHNVKVAVIGDVNEATAKRVGKDVPSRNARGVAWFSNHGGNTPRTHRIKTYLVPKDAFEQIAKLKTP